MEKKQKQKRIAILGSTGSIGTQTLSVIEQYPELFAVDTLIAGSKVDTLAQQALRWRPTRAIIADESKLWKLRSALEGTGIICQAGDAAIADAMDADTFDTVVTATVGYSGLAPTLRAIAAEKNIALANKETLVVAGDIVTRTLRSSRSKMLPVDSEHSAIAQCLVGEKHSDVRRLIITASGGPFRTFTAEQVEKVTAADALKHPNWSMGAKITIDSATMMNKAFEIIEARWLFGIPGGKIVPVVHPQSIIHSMVEFVDGSVKAQLGMPDMRLPIRYALGDASRLESNDSPLTFERCASLTFERPDPKRFPAVELGHYALERGGNTACIINAANEVAVDAFLHERIRFGEIYSLITRALEHVDFIKHPAYDDYVATNSLTRRLVEEWIGKI